MNESRGLALLCDLQGVIVRVLFNAWPCEIPSGRTFPGLTVPGSVSKALSFLADVKRKGAAFNWELNINIEGVPDTLHFAGTRLQDALLIVGAENNADVMRLFEEMVRMSNEQTDALRALLKDRFPTFENEKFFDEISRLNNELVTAQRELAKKNAELARLNEEKNRFLGMAAHDLRNPLHAALAYSDMLLADTRDEKNRELLRVIRNSCEFMARLIDDLLDVSRIEAGELVLDYAAVNLAELIERNAAVHRFAAANKNVEIDYRLNARPNIMVDPAKIEQVLNNLIRNAVKFSYAGSRVEVTLTDEGEGVRLSVRDYGVGMTPKEQERLFRPFGRGRAGTAGEKSTGLGLAIVKRIVEGHGGEIYIESQEGGGSTFTVSLPKIPKELKARNYNRGSAS